MEEYSNLKQIDRLKAGLKGGPFNDPATAPIRKFSFAEGFPQESLDSMTNGLPIAEGEGSTVDPWGQRQRAKQG